MSSDKTKIILGLLIFLAAITFPVWYSVMGAKPVTAIEVELPAGETKCIEDKDYMIANHMNVLDKWRNDLVREGITKYVATDGKEYEIGLTKTCLKCHANKEAFCDRCHEYADVDPYCWDCHVEPEGE